MQREKKLYLLLAILTAFLFAFEFKVEQESENAYEHLQVENIKSLTISTTANVYFIPSSYSSLKVEGDKDIIENLEVLQDGSNLVVQMKKIYNPIKLIQLAYESSKPVNIYISGPNAKKVELNNREFFASSNLYENQVSRMIRLKNPRLFSKINVKSATCSTLKTSNIM